MKIRFFLIVLIPTFLLTSTVGIYLLEYILSGNEESPYSSVFDSLWWTVVTFTTVGYGDMTPSTEIGRAIAYVLMIGGICIFGAITANLASFFVKTDGSIDNSLTELTEEIKILRSELKL